MTISLAGRDMPSARHAKEKLLIDFQRVISGEQEADKFSPRNIENIHCTDIAKLVQILIDQSVKVLR